MEFYGLKPEKRNEQTENAFRQAKIDALMRDGYDYTSARQIENIAWDLYARREFYKPQTQISTERTTT